MLLAVRDTRYPWLLKSPEDLSPRQRGGIKLTPNLFVYKWISVMWVQGPVGERQHCLNCVSPLADWMCSLSRALCVVVGVEPEPCRNSLTTHGPSVCSHGGQTSGGPTTRRDRASVCRHRRYPLSSSCSHSHLSEQLVFGLGFPHTESVVWPVEGASNWVPLGFTVCFYALEGRRRLCLGQVF